MGGCEYVTMDVVMMIPTCEVFLWGALMAHILEQETQVCRFWKIMQTESERGWGGFHKLAERSSGEQAKPLEHQTLISKLPSLLRGAPWLSSQLLIVLRKRFSIQALRTALLIPFVARRIYVVMTSSSHGRASRHSCSPITHPLLQLSRHWSAAVPHFTPHPESHVTCFTLGRRQG
jgi:hypothetical protein